MAEDFKRIEGASTLDLRKSLEDYHDLTRLLLDHPTPVICAVNGVATGIGAEMQLAADIRIASTEASIGFPESQRAMFETNAVTWLLPRLVGHGHAQHLLLTGEIIRAERAAQIGLFTEMVEPAQLAARANAIARRLADNAPLTVRGLKKMLRRTWESDMTTMMEHETLYNIACLRSRDLQEGVAAFIEKRKPKYVGR